jgi:hypothetical protein
MNNLEVMKGSELTLGIINASNAFACCKELQSRQAHAVCSQVKGE